MIHELSRASHNKGTDAHNSVKFYITWTTILTWRVKNDINVVNTGIEKNKSKKDPLFVIEFVEWCLLEVFPISDLNQYAQNFSRRIMMSLHILF